MCECIIEKVLESRIFIIEKVYLCVWVVVESYKASCMERKIIDKLKAWKDAADRKPLVLLGARQVGKTWIMKHLYSSNVACSSSHDRHED